jgi:hypothetical protein
MPRSVIVDAQLVSNSEMSVDVAQIGRDVQRQRLMDLPRLIEGDHSG